MALPSPHLFDPIPQSLPTTFFNPCCLSKAGTARGKGVRGPGEVSHLWSEAQQRGEKPGKVVHGDVPEECRKLGCISKQVPQNSHSQLHSGGRVLGLKSNNTSCFHFYPHGYQEEEEWGIWQQGAFKNTTVNINITMRSTRNRLHSRYPAVIYLPTERTGVYILLLGISGVLGIWKTKSNKATP